MFEIEKPKEIVIIKKPPQKFSDYNKRTRIKFFGSYDGYIRERLKFKCSLNGIILKEVSPNQVSIICSKCGGTGKKDNYVFNCMNCGYKISSAVNSAKNIENKYYGKFKIFNSQE